jgi:hypothetical protein
VVVLALSTAGAWAEGGASYPGTFNISGATLFKNFFKAPAGTNDFIDVDDNGYFGFHFDPPYVQQLAPDWGSAPYYWTVQFRGVGSGNGLKELVNFYNCAPPGPPPNPDFGNPTDQSTINRTVWWTTSGGTGPYNPANPGSCPVAPSSIDIAVMDVPTTWFITQGTEAQSAWNRKPVTDGYGMYPKKDWTGAQSNKLKSLACSYTSHPSYPYTLNVNTAAPDNKTVFDTEIAWVPVAFVANRGTGLLNVDMSNLQYMFVTGRTKNGENLVVVTRDSGSGTRNAAMNSIGVDPSWGRGDNLGAKINDITRQNLGSTFQASNLDSTGMAERAVMDSRLGVGYVGLAGVADIHATAGWYDCLNIRKDIAGGTSYVHPSLDSVLHNADVNTGWQIGGAETFATVGDPEYPTTGKPAPSNTAAAAYIRNISHSIAGFSGNPSSNQNYNMPGEYLAYNFTLMGALDAIPQRSPTVDPTFFVTNPGLNSELQSYTAQYNVINVPVNPQTPAGLCPYRNAKTSPDHYNDGSVNGSYTDSKGGNLTATKKLAARNAIAGDFLYDGQRNWNDICKMMEAIYDTTVLGNPLLFENGVDHGGNPGDQGVGHDSVIIHVIGDFNGDGNLDGEDARYFADGLAVDPATGRINRKEGFIRVDNCWYGLTNTYFFSDPTQFTTPTTLSTGKTYAAGDARGDVATPVGAPAVPSAYMGSIKSGANGVIDQYDVLYVKQNLGNWASLDDASKIDLSCDMDGDLDVDNEDVRVLVEDILGSWIGDINLDGSVDSADVLLLANAFGSVKGGGSWDLRCDLNGDGKVDISDLLALARNYGRHR